MTKLENFYCNENGKLDMKVIMSSLKMLTVILKVQGENIIED
ncbi:hypothetical protein [Bacillus sp. ISL-4]|nr:hypothetical protein [Bacillus sp. ISL-4]